MGKQKNLVELTDKEEELMLLFWQHGPLYVKQIVEMYPDPKPHFNTISTFVRNLESKGYLAHKATGNTYQYFAVVEMRKYRSRSFGDFIKSYFNNSYFGAVSALVEEEKLSVDELKELIELVEKRGKKD